MYCQLRTSAECSIQFSVFVVLSFCKDIFLLRLLNLYVRHFKLVVFSIEIIKYADYLQDIAFLQEGSLQGMTDPMVEPGKKLWNRNQCRYIKSNRISEREQLIRIIVENLEVRCADQLDT